MDSNNTTTPQAFLAQNRQPEIYAIHTIFFVLAVVAVAARVYTAAYLGTPGRRAAGRGGGGGCCGGRSSNSNNSRLAAHDWLAVAAGVGTVGVYTCSMLWLRFGLGRHAAWTRRPESGGGDGDNGGANIRRFLQTVMANEVLYTTTLVCARLSLVIFYYRIFGVTNMRYWLHFVVAGIVAWALYSVSVNKPF